MLDTAIQDPTPFFSCLLCFTTPLTDGIFELLVSFIADLCGLSFADHYIF